MKILVTGANGFIGRSLCPALDKSGYTVIRAVRNPASPLEVGIGDLCSRTDWGSILTSKIDTVIHLAGEVPESASTPAQTTDDYFRTNSFGTANLAQECARYGVRRFIFLSTIKVLGEGKRAPYQFNDPPTPLDAYAASKWEAEKSIQLIAQTSRLETVVVRPPLVYGPGVKGNFLRLMQAVDRRSPLPVGAINNRRSLVYLGNLIDLIQRCVHQSEAAGKTFLVSDGDDVSTPELVRRIAAALGRFPILLPVPPSMLRALGFVLRNKERTDRLLDSLAVDITPLQRGIAWTPPHMMQEGLEATARWYRKCR